MKLRPFTFVLAFSLLLPIALLIGNSSYYNQCSIFEEPRFLAENWLYMALPQLLLGILALPFVRGLLRVGLVACARHAAGLLSGLDLAGSSRSRRCRRLDVLHSAMDRNIDRRLRVRLGGRTA